MLNPSAILRAELPGLLSEVGDLEGGRILFKEPNVRVVEPEDLEAVDRFVRAQPWVKVFEWETIDSWRDMLKSGACSAFMAEDFRKDIIGCAFCFRAPRGQLCHFAVDPDCQGNGVGTKMLGAALRWFKNVGIEQVSVTVADDNRNGKEYWQRQGFKLITAEGGESVLMVKKI